MALGQKSGLGMILLVLAVVVVAAGGYYAMNKAPSAEDINQVTQNSIDNVNMNVNQVDTDANLKSDTISVAPKGKDKSAAATAAMENSEIQVEQGNPVVARVDGKEITRVDVYRFIQTMPQQMQQMPAVQVYPIAMEQVINTRIVQNKANAADVTNSEQFKLEMEMAKQQIARNLYLQEQVDKKISEGKLKKLYNEQIKEIPDIEERRARHILVDTEDKAKAVVKKLATGEKFEDLAKSLSMGPTGKNGGDLGYFGKADMVPEFADAAFQMEKNSILETPVKTQFGWHVIQLVDIRQRPKPTFEQVEPMLRAEARREALDDLLQDWRKDAKIEQFDINGKPLKDGANATGLIPTTNSPAPAGG